MVPRSPTTLLAPPLLATRPRLLRPIEPRLAARLDAIVAIPQPQSSRDSRPATNAVVSEQLQPAHHRPRRRSSSRLDVNPTSHDAAEATALDVRRLSQRPASSVRGGRRQGPATFPTPSRSVNASGVVANVQRTLFW